MRPIDRSQKIVRRRAEHARACRCHKPVACTARTGPRLAVGVTKSVAAVIGKKRFNALFAQICWSVGAIARTNGRISQFKATLVRLGTIVAIPSLQVADYHLSTGAIVGIVREGFHGQHLPTFVVLGRNPTVVRSELCEVANERFHEIFPIVHRCDIALGHENFLLVFANGIPLSGILDGAVRNLVVAAKKFILERRVLTFETFGNGFLTVAVAANVSGRVRNAKWASAQDFVAMNLPLETAEICACSRHFADVDFQIVDSTV